MRHGGAVEGMTGDSAREQMFAPAASSGEVRRAVAVRECGPVEALCDVGMSGGEVIVW